ncbi:MAG: type IV secretion system protein, partial [Rickettsiales bacterium]|nr:type IV secretion system protein [Rickettsiales bacterium]
MSEYSFAQGNNPPPNNPPPNVGGGEDRGVEIRQSGTADITSQRYSVQEDLSGFCRYTSVTEDGVEYKALDINTNIYNSDNILMGISNPKYCPLPGRDFLPDGYPDAIAGEFLLSGVVCVVQSIVLDSMFRVFCSILLWFYQILLAMIIVYVMFYGLAIMFDLTEEPLKQAPAKIILIMFIILLSSNAQFSFKWIFGTFNTVLTTFSDILTRLQPLYSEGGERVYDSEGRLLDINGNVWKPLANGTPYVYVNSYTSDTGQFIENENPHTIGDGLAETPTSMPIKNGTHNFEFIPANEAYKYVPFRVPAQQWQGKMEEVNGVKSYKIYPVFKQIYDPVSQNNAKVTACVVDFKYNYQLRRVELFPRCSEKNWPVIPDFSPYGAAINKNLSPVGEESQYSGFPNYGSPLLTPPKLLDQTGNVDAVCDEASNPRSCRKPFQGIIGKIDALFDSVVGDDRAKGLTSMVIALSLWAGGGGTFLSFFLLTGILTMFIAFVQILWVYVTAFMGLTFLMMLAPLFVTFKLFKITESMFNAWASMLVSFMLQPVIVLGIVYVLSNATSLDRLTSLARNELGTKQYVKSKGTKDSPTINYSAPGFLEPLYEYPTDYQEMKDLYGGEASGLSNVEGDSISLTQRKLYRKLKERYFVTYYKFILAGFSDEQARASANNTERIAAINNSQTALDFSNLYNNKTTISEGTPPKPRQIEGIDAILYYATNPTAIPAGMLVTQAQLNEFLRIYREGVNSPIDSPILDTPLGIEDGDAYIGEPRNPPEPAPALNARGEYPNCVKYCPEFHPPYDASDIATTSPTSQQCVGFCLYSYADKEEMFSYISGAIIIWLLLNAMVGAFMSQVPSIAEKLSRIYNVGSPKIYGTSAGNQPTKWATGARADVSNLGSVFDMGIFSGAPGALARLGDTLQMKANRTRIMGNDGIPVEQKGRSMFEDSPLSILNKKQDPMVTAYDAIKLLQDDPAKKNLLEYAEGYQQGNIDYRKMEEDIRKEVLSKEPTKKNWTKEEIKEKYIKVLQKKKEEADKKKQGSSSFNYKSSGGGSYSPTEESLIDTRMSSLDAGLEMGGNREAISTRTSSSEDIRFSSEASVSVEDKKYDDWLSKTTESPANYQGEFGGYDTMPISQREYDEWQAKQKQQQENNLGQKVDATAFAPVTSKVVVKPQDAKKGNVMNLISSLDPSKVAQNKNYQQLKEALAKGDVKGAAVATANLTKQANQLKKDTPKKSKDNKPQNYQDLVNVEGASRMDIAVDLMPRTASQQEAPIELPQENLGERINLETINNSQEPVLANNQTQSQPTIQPIPVTPLKVFSQKPQGGILSQFNKKPEDDKPKEDFSENISNALQNLAGTSRSYFDAVAIETPAGSNINQAENLGEPIVSTSSPEKPNITSEQQQLTTSQSQNQNS